VLTLVSGSLHCVGLLMQAVTDDSESHRNHMLHYKRHEADTAVDVIHRLHVGDAADWLIRMFICVLSTR
jgi:hypothetical protein